MNIRGVTKLNQISQVLEQRRIAILALQETHMSDSRCEEMADFFKKRMTVFSTADPEKPSACAGVAIVLNNSHMLTEGAISTTIVPGRALLVQTNWHAGDQITILAIYAPNLKGADGSESKAFFQKIQKFFEENPLVAKPEIVLGDFNVVEDPLD